MAGSLPSLDAFRNSARRLMDRRNISQGRLARLMREAEGLDIHQSSISRFLDGGDIRYGHAYVLWNVLLDAQDLSPDAPITEAMTPLFRIAYATPSMTMEEVEDDLAQRDLDYAPWIVEGIIEGVVDVRLAHAMTPTMDPDDTLQEELEMNPDIISWNPPRTYSHTMKVHQVRDDMHERMEKDPTRALGLVKKGLKVIGLVAPYNFLGVS